MVALQLVGSPTSDFFFNLSMLYAEDVIVLEGFELLFATAYPDGRWSVGKSIHLNDRKISLSQMVSEVRHADIVVPHMFCPIGLSSVRNFFEEILKIPLVGSSGHTLNVAQNKNLTKLILQAAGVPVPKGSTIDSSRMTSIDENKFAFPIIIKPNSTDNSDGLSLVRQARNLKQALRKAFQFDKKILVEEFIPGREVRGAILKRNGVFSILPFIEYGVNSDRPIRNAEDKLKFDDKGNLIAQSEKLQVPAKCPAELSEALTENLGQLMISSHKALGCRDYSMYDFRIHGKTGQPYILEAGLFWSFSEKSMISSMLKANSLRLEDITHELWSQTVSRKSSLG